MKGFIYILARTFPFWAIPMGIAFMTTWYYAGKKQETYNKNTARFWLFSGLLLISLSILFLYFQINFSAVPWIHEMLNPDKNF